MCSQKRGASDKSSQHRAKKRDFEFADFRGLRENSGGTSNQQHQRGPLAPKPKTALRFPPQTREVGGLECTKLYCAVYNLLITEESLLASARGVSWI
jgi:hypothetical protein